MGLHTSIEIISYTNVQISISALENVYNGITPVSGIIEELKMQSGKYIILG